VTKSYPCPHCQKVTISLWRRLCLGPAWPATCSACGKRVGVPWWSLWLVLLFSLAGYGLGLSLMGRGKPILVLVVVVTIFFPLCVAWVRWVPLIKR
jgi:hypothetical protein